jgi:copper/silver efflux system protein
MGEGTSRYRRRVSPRMALQRVMLLDAALTTPDVDWLTTAGEKNIKTRRDDIARDGLTVGDVQDVIQSAVGGMNITTTVEGLERYPVDLRYSRELRDNVPALGDILVPTPLGQHIPLGQLADVETVKGPPGIKTETLRPNAWIYVDLEGSGVGTYVRMAQRAVAEQVEVPAGYAVGWSGRYEYMMHAQEV